MKKSVVWTFFFLLCIGLTLPVRAFTAEMPIIIDHTCTNIWQIPESAIQKAKETLHIAYGHTSHGSQLISGMGSNGTQLDAFMTANGATPGLFVWHDGPRAGTLDLDDYFVSGDLGNPDRVTWAQRTRNYLDDPRNADVNVVIWSWCGQVGGSESDINTYLNLMNQLETDYPDVLFVYMTGHLNGTGESGTVNLRNNQIRKYCLANNKILYDFADIESYDPDGLVNYMPLAANDNCDYDSDGNGSRDANWAAAWQNSHIEGADWWASGAAHSQHLNGNRKGYAAWWLWATLAGWNQCAAAPSDLLAQAEVMTQSIHLTWTDNSNAINEDVFILQRREEGDAWDDSYASVTADVTEYTDTAVVAGIAYDYRVVAYRADNGQGESCYSGASNTARGEIMLPEPPVPPSDLSGSADSIHRSVALSWQDNSDNESAFVVQRQAGDAAWEDAYATLSENTFTFTDSDLAPGTYVYRVVAVNSYGESLPSNETDFLVIVDLPLSPTGLNAVGDALNGTVTLTWTDNSDNEDGFRIQRQENGGSWDGSYATVDENVTTYIDDNNGQPPLSNGTYVYWVIAVNADGVSGPSNDAQAIIATSVPSIPSNLGSTLNGFDITLTWDDTSDNEDHFVIERRIDNGEFNVLDDSVPPNSETYSDSGLQPLNTYTYRLRAVNSFGMSDYSNETVQYIAEKTDTIILKQNVNGYSGCRDTYLVSNRPEDNFGGDLYNDIQDEPKANFIISFDMPVEVSGKKILEARIGFYCWRISSYADNQHLDLYRMTEAWTEGSADGAYQEGSASWKIRGHGTGGEMNWSMPGGSYNPRLLGRSLILSSAYYPEFDITDLVQQWVDGTTENFGVMLQNDSIAGTGIKASEYSEYGRPYLEITYTSITGYTLTVESTDGGSVTTPGEGTFPCKDGDSVTLTAVPEPGFEFSGWAGNVLDQAASKTTIQMNADNTVTANFTPVAVDYNLTVASGEGGTVTSPGEGTFSYEDGSVAHLIAVAEDGFEFSGWTGEVLDTAAAETTVIMDGHKSVRAEFTPVAVNHTLTVQSSAGGTVRAPGEGAFTYTEAMAVNLKAEPDPGYEFSGWTGDVYDADTPETTVLMDADKTVKATFTVIVVNVYLEVSSAPDGDVILPGEGTFAYAQGTIVDLFAAADQGYEFAGWNGDVADPNAAATTIVMDGHKTVSARFAPMTIMHKLIVSSTEGGIVVHPGEGAFEYAADTIVDLIAEPDQGFEFAGWIGDVADPKSVVTTVSLDAEKNIQAHFTSVSTTHELRITSDAGGTITTPGEGAFTYDSGTVVNLVAVPDEGFIFTGWIGEVADPNALETTIDMTADTSVHAGFSFAMAAHYKLDRNYNDFSGNENHGLNNGTKLTDGRIDGAAFFNGRNSYIEADGTSELNIADEITVSTWIYYEEQDENYAAIVSKMDFGISWRRSCYALGLSYDRIRYGTDGGSHLSTQRLEKGRWYHLAMIHKEGTTTLFINGQMDASASDTFTRTSSQPLTIGARKFFIFRVAEYTGRIDDVRIYNRALSAQDIAVLFDEAPVSQVINLTASATDEGIQLRWQKPSDSNAAGVILIRTPQPEKGIDYENGSELGESIVVYKGDGEHFTDTGIEADRSYYYQAVSFDSILNYSQGVGVHIRLETEQP